MPVNFNTIKDFEVMKHIIVMTYVHILLILNSFIPMRYNMEILVGIIIISYVSLCKIWLLILTYIPMAHFGVFQLWLKLIYPMTKNYQHIFLYYMYYYTLCLHQLHYVTLKDTLCNEHIS